MNEERVFIPTDLPHDMAFLSEKEYCLITGQTGYTARSYRIKGGGCWYYKIGGLVRYKLSDVLDDIEKGKRSSTSDF